MAKSKLKAALDAQKGVDYKQLKDKKQRKQGEKRKREKEQKKSKDADEDEDMSEDDEEGGVLIDEEAVVVGYAQGGRECREMVWRESSDVLEILIGAGM